ncbi:Gfo/Idh/MocA family protein [Mycolicibacterium wolinskyi]|nr:Gfo/Idh/MocA family oxidoreductase [Mycolicibacterium wolinskyi]
MRGHGQACLFFGAGPWGRNVVEAFVACGGDPRGFLVRANPETRHWLSARFPGVMISSDPAELLDSVAAPIVVVATPRDTHADLAELALRARRDVFVEKPMATEPADCTRLTSIADAEGVALFTGFTYLYHGAYACLRDAIAANEIEQLTFTWNRPGLRGPTEWELLPHDLAIAIGLTGHTPARIRLKVTGGRVQCRWALDDNRIVQIEHDGGGSGPKDKRVRVVTKRGDVWEWRGNHLAMWDSATETSEPDLAIDYSPKEPLVREVKWFLEHRADRSAMRADAALSTSVTELINRALTEKQE